MPKCTPPKSTSVRSYWRARPRKKRSGPKAGETYYVAETPNGRTCGHHHRRLLAAHSCATKENRKLRRQGLKANYDTTRKTA